MSDREIDQQLVDRAQRGDKQAFELLVAKYQRKLARLLSRFIRDPAEVEDVAQEAFIKAYRALPSFRGEAALLAGSGFLGVTLGMALPPEGLAAVLPPVPALLVPLAVPVVLIATSLLGLNPIAVVAVIGALVPDPAALGVAPGVLALACMLGWGVGVGMTPLSASALATARWTGSDPWTVTTRWNRAFTLAGLAFALAVLAAAHAGWLPFMD